MRTFFVSYVFCGKRTGNMSFGSSVYFADGKIDSAWIVSTTEDIREQLKNKLKEHGVEEEIEVAIINIQALE